MQRRTYLGTIGTATVTAVAGCMGGGSETEDRDAVGTWADGAIEFALPPFEDAEDLKAEYSEVFEWIGDGFDLDSVEGVSTTSYSAVVESVTNGHTELANLSPIIYVLAIEEEIHPIALNWSHGSDAYHSYIATREDTDIETLADIEGKTIAMVDPLSTSGGLFPRYMLSEAGLDAGDVSTEPGDFDIEWSSGHPGSLTALEEGHVDAAAYGDFQHPDSDEIVKVAESDPIPFDPIVAKPDTPEAVREELAQRLLDTPEEALEDHRIDRFGEVEDGTYEPVRNVAEAMGIEISDLESDE